MTDRSLGRTLWNLVLALLNATLILVAICLFFGWKLAQTVDGISTRAAQAVVDARPISSEFRALREEVAGLRGDLQGLGTGTSTLSPVALRRIDTRLEEMNTRLTSVSERVETTLENPEPLIDHAIQAAAAELSGFVVGMRNCRSGSNATDPTSG